MSKLPIFTSLMLIAFVVNGFNHNIASTFVTGRLCTDTAGSSITGKLKYSNNQQTPLVHSLIYLRTASGTLLDSTMTDLYGNYKFCGLPDGTYTITAKTNLPAGGINITDALLVLRHFIGNLLPEGLSRKAADANYSGFINSSDALDVQKRFLDILTDFPGGDWLFEEKSVDLSGDTLVVADLNALCTGDVNADYSPPVVSQPCPGIPSFEYGGQTYTTVLIGTQCWMKENLNIGTRTADTSNQTDNGSIEKYCYEDNDTNCSTYGGLYQWDEMMQYDSLPGAQGICPAGWHIPTDDEWCTMTRSIDFTINCYSAGWDGSTAGITMMEASSGGWNSNPDATNQSGFSAPGSGYRNTHKCFRNLGLYALYWSSSRNSVLLPWYRSLYGSKGGIYRYTTIKSHGFSVRCVKN